MSNEKKDIPWYLKYIGSLIGAGGTILAALISGVFLLNDFDVVLEKGYKLEQQHSNQEKKIQNISDKITITKKIFSREYSITLFEGPKRYRNISVVINYPQMSGHPDKTIQRNINKLLRQQSGLLKGHEEAYSDHESRYELKSNINNIISFTFEDNGEYVGAVTSFTDNSSLNINLVNGAPFELKDLFRSNYKKLLSSLISEQKLCGKEDVSVYDNQNFYFTSDSVVVIYSRGEICARAAGVIEAKVNLDRLASIINPNGPLSSLLN